MSSLKESYRTQRRKSPKEGKMGVAGTLWQSRGGLVPACFNCDIIHRLRTINPPHQLKKLSTHQLSPPAYQQTTISDCVPSDAEYHQPSTITATIKLTKWKWIQIASSISWYLIPNFFTFPQQHKSCPSYYSAWHTTVTKSFVLSLSLFLSCECIKSPDPHRPVADKPHLRKVQLFCPIFEVQCT